MPFFRSKDCSLPLGEKTYIMGILNVTPDSFFDGGKWCNAEDAVSHALKMKEDGADIIDIGAQSTRPGHTAISPDEEIERLTPVLNAVKIKTGLPVSVDTYYAKTAEFALQNGADIINDVSGAFNEKMAEIIKRFGAGWIITHTGEADANAQKEYKEGIIKAVGKFFEEMLKKVSEYGIEKEKICLDVGIGFGKSKEDNILLLKELEKLKTENALMVGASRKRFLQKDNDTPEDRLLATIEANTAAIKGKADILRVHDVLECANAARAADLIHRQEKEHG